MYTADKKVNPLIYEYEYAGVFWNGLLRYQSLDAKPSSHFLCPEDFDKLGRPDRIIVLVMPVAEP